MIRLRCTLSKWPDGDEAWSFRKASSACHWVPSHGVRRAIPCEYIVMEHGVGGLGGSRRAAAQTGDVARGTPRSDPVKKRHFWRLVNRLFFKKENAVLLTYHDDLKVKRPYIRCASISVPYIGSMGSGS